MIGLFLAAAVAAAQPADRGTVGNWYVSDDTDNNTGERKVYALQVHFEKYRPDFVTLFMRCTDGKPTLTVDWTDQVFPDEAVLSIGPLPYSGANPVETSYVFEKVTDPAEEGLRGSPATSAAIMAAIGQAPFATFTAHLSSGTTRVEIPVDGTQQAWDRVSRHCPVQKMPVPPL